MLNNNKINRKRIRSLVKEASLLRANNSISEEYFQTLASTALAWEISSSMMRKLKIDKSDQKIDRLACILVGSADECR